MGEIGAARPKPLWRRIVDYPLVTMLIAISIVFLCFTVGLLLAQFLLPPIQGFSLEMKFDLASIPFLLVAYELIIRRLGEHPRDDYRDPRWFRNLGLGLGAGLLVFSAAVAISALLGVYRITGEGDLTGLIPALIGPALFAAISEELMFRGILFHWFEEWGGSWVALLVTSALFGSAHLLNPHASPIAAAGVGFGAGIMLSAAYMLTRSLWMPMGLHAAWNFAQGEIYDIPVSGTPVHGMLTARLSGPPLLSGNGFGLEASLTAILVATVFGLWLLWLAIRNGQLIQPRWVRRRNPSKDPLAKTFA
ncbi:MAG TPA: type II CAAX endopeptidase family protein [Sphingomicrobium sp.]|nr:type II CAAX endopeptidase family protein [Sphingomicrobium sp.]